MLSLVSYGWGMSSLVDGNWRRLADYVRSARVERGFSSQGLLADAAGVSEGSVRTLESGKAYVRMPVIVPAVERVLGWEPGTARKLIEGEDPFTTQQIGPMSKEEKEAFTEVVLRSKSLGRAAREELLDEIKTAVVRQD